MKQPRTTGRVCRGTVTAVAALLALLSAALVVEILTLKVSAEPKSITLEKSEANRTAVGLSAEGALKYSASLHSVTVDSAACTAHDKDGEALLHAHLDKPVATSGGRLASTLQLPANDRGYGWFELGRVETIRCDLNGRATLLGVLTLPAADATLTFTKARHAHEEHSLVVRALGVERHVALPSGGAFPLDLANLTAAAARSGSPKGRIADGRMLFESSHVPLGASFPHKLAPLTQVRSSTGLKLTGHGDSFGEATFLLHPALVRAVRASTPSLESINIDSTLLTMTAQHHVAVGPEAKHAVEAGVVCRPMHPVHIDLKKSGPHELSFGYTAFATLPSVASAVSRRDAPKAKASLAPPAVAPTSGNGTKSAFLDAIRRKLSHVNNLHHYFLAFGGSMAIGAAGPASAVGLGVRVNVNSGGQFPDINVHVNGRVDSSSVDMDVHVPSTLMAQPNTLSGLTVTLTPSTGQVEIDRFASTITPTITYTSSAFPITVSANQVLTAGGSIAYAATLNQAGSGPTLDFTATPTSVAWFQPTSLNMRPTFAFDNGVAINLPQTSLRYGSSSLAMAFSLTGTSSFGSLTASLAPSGSDFSFVDAIDAGVTVSYGSPFPIQITRAELSVGAQSVTGTFSLTTSAGDDTTVVVAGTMTPTNIDWLESVNGGATVVWNSRPGAGPFPINLSGATLSIGASNAGAALSLANSADSFQVSASLTHTGTAFSWLPTLSVSGDVGWTAVTQGRTWTDAGQGTGVHFSTVEYSTTGCSGAVNPSIGVALMNFQNSPNPSCVYLSPTSSVMGNYCDMSSNPPRYRGTFYYQAGGCTGASVPMDYAADGTCTTHGTTSAIYTCTTQAPTSTTTEVWPVHTRTPLNLTIGNVFGNNITVGVNGTMDMNGMSGSGSVSFGLNQDAPLVMSLGYTVSIDDATSLPSGDFTFGLSSVGNPGQVAASFAMNGGGISLTLTPTGVTSPTWTEPISCTFGLAGQPFPVTASCIAGSSSLSASVGLTPFPPSFPMTLSVIVTPTNFAGTSIEWLKPLNLQVVVAGGVQNGISFNLGGSSLSYGNGNMPIAFSLTGTPTGDGVGSAQLSLSATPTGTDLTDLIEALTATANLNYAFSGQTQTIGLTGTSFGYGSSTIAATLNLNQNTIGGGFSQTISGSMTPTGVTGLEALTFSQTASTTSTTFPMSATQSIAYGSWTLNMQDNIDVDVPAYGPGRITILSSMTPSGTGGPSEWFTGEQMIDLDVVLRDGSSSDTILEVLPIRIENFRVRFTPVGSSMTFDVSLSGGLSNVAFSPSPPMPLPPPPPVYSPPPPLPPQQAYAATVRFEAVVASTVETFDQEAYKTGLASLLEHVTAEQITLTVAPASIRVTAEIQTTVTVEEAQNTVVATLDTLTTSDLAAAVGVSVASVAPPTVEARVIPASEITAGTLPGGTMLDRLVESTGMSIGTIAGIAAGGAVLLVIFIVIISYCLCCKPKPKEKLVVLESNPVGQVFGKEPETKGTEMTDVTIEVGGKESEMPEKI